MDGQWIEEIQKQEKKGKFLPEITIFSFVVKMIFFRDFVSVKNYKITFHLDIFHYVIHKLDAKKFGRTMFDHPQRAQRDFY